MNNIARLAEVRVRQWLQTELDAARRAHRPFAVTIKKIRERLEDLGMDMGFIPIEPLHITKGFRSASVVIALYGYTDEVTIAA